MDFAQILRALRIDIKFTQQKIASDIGIGRTTYTQYEIGVSEPNFETLCALADYFGVTTDQLLGRASLPDKNEEEENVTDQQLLEKIKCLDGISLPEWSKIKFTIDESFRRKATELEGELKLSCDDDVRPTIRSLFE